MSDRLAAALAELTEALREELRAEAAPTNAPDRLLSVDEAGAILGLGRSLLYAELQSGHLRSLKVGRRRLVTSAAIGEYINEKAAPAIVRPGAATEARRARVERPISA